MIRITLASNAIHLEAARRLLEHSGGRRAGLELLLWEPARFRLDPADARRWPLRLPVRPLSFLLLAPALLLGVVAELRLAHRREAGVGLRWLIARARRLTLLDDGLDQYRDRPRALDPQAFPAGLEYWLFSDAPSGRAPWCDRFRCRELGPLYPPPARREPPSGPAGPAPGGQGTLIIDSPGVERLESEVDALPRPLCLIRHPVRAKRSWRRPPQPGELELAGPPEALLPGWAGTVVVGESLMLLAALGLRPPGARLLLSLPAAADPRLHALARQLAAGQPLVTVL